MSVYRGNFYRRDFLSKPGTKAESESARNPKVSPGLLNSTAPVRRERNDQESLARNLLNRRYSVGMADTPSSLERPLPFSRDSLQIIQSVQHQVTPPHPPPVATGQDANLAIEASRN